MKKAKTLLILGAALGAASALNAAITTGVDLVTGGSFEDVDFPFGGGNANRLQFNDWFEINDTGSSSAVEATFTEAAQAGDVNFTPTAPDGTFWLNLAPRPSTNPAGAYQQLGVWNTGDVLQFDLTATLGERSNTPDFSDMTFDLYKTTDAVGASDGTDLTSLAGAALVGSFGTFTQSDLGAIAPATLTIAGINDGDLLWLRISSNTASSSGGNQSMVDIVTVTAVPEPSTFALLAGFVTLGLVILRRRQG